MNVMIRVGCTVIYECDNFAAVNEFRDSETFYRGSRKSYLVAKGLWNFIADRVFQTSGHAEFRLFKNTPSIGGFVVDGLNFLEHL